MAAAHPAEQERLYGTAQAWARPSEAEEPLRQVVEAPQPRAPSEAARRGQRAEPRGAAPGLFPSTSEAPGGLQGPAGEPP
ncbi:hypothetical protein DB31_4310 [Hyalangium minutum]|uniref:Uncharacterized protein n=1 Tax=Hyalangium minutum TaxID=394096 RepID=A0A085W3E1_9BACT|nr:hypothetical protein DB31_4310 [Hyalangium minutum]